MKIACLQFAPQIGDIDNNLNRADAVLNRANPLDLDDLDLLVLPELAFTGMLLVSFSVKMLTTDSPKVTIFTLCGTSLRTSRDQALALVLFGLAQRPSNTIAMLSLATRRKLTSHRNGPPPPSITTLPSLSTGMVRRSPITGRHSCIQRTSAGH